MHFYDFSNISKEISISNNSYFLKLENRGYTLDAEIVFSIIFLIKSKLTTSYPTPKGPS
ncbi:hypothetical protein CLOACE_04380 [Clostridium acetireducens DSM 10703]|uniref:Uncharacterized protein n=1 Tax=Clostridium acetireducens DSM 10703 TaxID=1121290 RepID=A0A1E8F1D1_9CLOT|nr:hypothetical protein [Clostridium acetireducens]OFI07245.1 hypothetical protein CLOACE_04380 [Clostridium acetireducens DSM 10703]